MRNATLSRVEDRRALSSPGPCESMRVVRFLLAAAAAGGANALQLAFEARVPAWALADEGAMISSCHALRLWELAERALQDPDVALGVAARYQLGELGLYDYLFRTAATLREGLDASRRYLPLVTTNGQLRADTRTGRDVTYSYACLDADGRGQELAVQFSIALFCARARAGTGRPVSPVHIGFSQPAPRSCRAFIDTFGTRRIDFGTPATTFTFRASDLDLTMRGADQVLAGILRRAAASVPPPTVATWHERFRRQLNQALEQGSPSLTALARRMSLSTRTLQRRLAEHGTTWRAELDAARRQHAQHARRAGSPTMTLLATQLGYADPRSARRALRRWDTPAP
jgi:AraC-like DNA-binding protein